MVSAMTLLAPFPYFGGKRTIAADVWKRLGSPKQYIEPFCGSLAILLSAPKPASLEVVNDGSGFIANFWRAVKHQAPAVAQWADYPVSHIDLGARHRWLMEQRDRIGQDLHDPNYPGDAQVAGWWLWGQCCWIGGYWCNWHSQIPHVGDAGRGVQAIGRIPHVSSAGMGVQAIGGIPHVSDAGRGVQAIGKIPHVSSAGMGGLLTSSGRTAMDWLCKIADRIERVRIMHGDWSRCLNHHYGKDKTAVFLDPPYLGYENIYSKDSSMKVADSVAEWAKEHKHIRIALCGHIGDYNLPGWHTVKWSRKRLTYGGSKTKNQECVWYSPACEAVAEKSKPASLFNEAVV